ncbi:MAG: GMC family oxidoreductase [Actinobacteria bacterium]|nr:GMC family oxidoreductase [Actinomycetota bacterium]
MRDVIVVGAGGGGPVVAKELAARGLDVLLLEAGAGFEHSESEWSHFENEANNPATGIFRFGPSDRTQPPWARDLPQNCFLWQTAGVGGSTLHYFANSPRAMPGAFSDYIGADVDAYDRDHVAPFGYRELIPYYEWVEQTLPVQTAAMGTKEERFLHGAAKLGLPHQTSKDITVAAFRPQENAILQPHGTAGRTGDRKKLVYPRAQGCTFCGHCPQGCVEPRRSPRNLRAKRSTHTSYVPMALTADRWTRGKAVTLVPDSFAVRVETDGGVVRGITWRNVRNGATTTEQAKVVVLAAGPVETPRLWLNSGLPNPNDQVGRGLTDHYLDYLVGRFPSYTGSSKGPTSAARLDFPGFGGLEQAGVSPGLQGQALTSSDSGIAGFYDHGAPVGTWGTDAVGRLVGERLKRFMSNIDRLVGVALITDDDVLPENRVMLSMTMAPDAHGPIARLVIPARSPRTLKRREYLAGRAVGLLRAAGATEVIRVNFPGLLLHLHSTMRMGIRQADSVLDSDAESRWVKRLFVADNSALPNGLGGPNPTLTTQALATRTAEKIFVRYFGGDPWVAHESPVSSVDDTVTQAVLAAGL